VATELRLDMVGRLDGARRTPQGGLRAPANLTRTGVLVYRNADGSTTRELRHPDEVFHADSLESLKLAPLTVGHPGTVTPSNYTTLAVGMVSENVRKDGRFVAADVLVQDARTVALVERKDLAELSCGYEVTIDPTPGEYEGERYDCVQRNIRYNHVGLGPANWGRAGNEVRLKLDGVPDVEVKIAHYAGDMTVRTDAPAGAPSLDTLTAQNDGLKTELERVRAENTRLKADAEKATKSDGKDGPQKPESDRSSIDLLVASRIAVYDAARAVLGASFECRTDAGPMSEREVHLAVIRATDKDFKSDGRSDEYLRARFDVAVEQARASAKAHAQVNADSATPGNGAEGADPIAKAREAQAKRNDAASKAGAPEGSLTRAG
jgi:uncharacterized protein